MVDLGFRVSTGGWYWDSGNGLCQVSERLSNSLLALYTVYNNGRSSSRSQKLSSLGAMSTTILLQKTSIWPCMWVGKNIFITKFCVTKWFWRKYHLKRKNIVKHKIHYPFKWIQLNGNLKIGECILKYFKQFLRHPFNCRNVGQVQLSSNFFLLLSLISHSRARFEHAF